MLRLMFALWRRDVAARKVARIERMNVTFPRHARRREKYMMRAEKWATIATALLPQREPQR